MHFVAALDLGEIIQWIANHIGPIFVGVFFFAVPILRAIKEAANKKRKQAAGLDAPPAQQREAQSEGRQMWEELLRGEQPAPVVPPPMPAPRPELFEGAEQAQNAPSLAGRLSDFAGDSDENALESESALDQERRAVEINDEMLRVEMLRRSDFLARERESAARVCANQLRRRVPICLDSVDTEGGELKTSPMLMISLALPSTSSSCST